MTRQKQAPEFQDLCKHADKYLELCVEFFHGMREKLDEVKTATNMDSTWAAATDDMKSEPQTEDVFDLYIEQLERRAYEHAKRGETSAAGAIRRIINELRALNNIDQTP